LGDRELVISVAKNLVQTKGVGGEKERIKRWTPKNAAFSKNENTGYRQAEHKNQKVNEREKPRKKRTTPRITGVALGDWRGNEKPAKKGAKPDKDRKKRAGGFLLLVLPPTEKEGQ